VNHLRSFKFFDEYIQTIASVFPSGKIGGFFVNIYDNTIQNSIAIEQNNIFINAPAPVKRTVLAKRTVLVKQSTHLKQSALVKQSPPVKRAIQMNQSAPVKRVTQVKQSAPVKRGTQVKQSTLDKQSALVKQSAPSSDTCDFFTSLSYFSVLVT
jgi:hypothetical protein